MVRTYNELFILGSEKGAIKLPTTILIKTAIVVLAGTGQ
jgi:hypothetical protein